MNAHKKEGLTKLINGANSAAALAEQDPNHSDYWAGVSADLFVKAFELWEDGQ